MQKFFKQDLTIIFFIVILFCLLLPFFYLHQGLLSVDTGREFYLSQQVFQGGVLYKDIFNIYGPFSYQFNALLFAIFGEKITTLYNTGILNSLVILISLYLISREFLSKISSFLFCIMVMFSLVFNVFLYNSNITYSFAIIYALSSFLVSLLFLIKYIKNSKSGYIYLSCLFAGLSIVNKYEFILYPLILIYVFCFLKPLISKEKLYAALSFCIFPVISFGVLFYQGLSISDLKNALDLMVIMSKSDNMRIFYSNFGNFFNPYFIYITFIKNPVIALLGFLPLANLGLFLFRIKSIYKDKPLFIFCISSIAASVKFLMFLNIEHMGAFLFPLCLLTLLILCKLKNLLNIILTGLIVLFAFIDFTSLNDKNYYLQTNKGNIYTYRKDGEPIKKISEYLIQNTNEDDKVVILPEGTMINFVSDRKSDNIYHTLLPLYYNSVFKEDDIINHFNDNPAQYFIILPLSTIEYGSKNFYKYAENFYEMININYNLIKEEDNIRIYKRKNM